MTSQKSQSDTNLIHRVVESSCFAGVLSKMKDSAGFVFQRQVPKGPEGLRKCSARGKERPQDFGVRLRSIAQDINNNCNVEGLCRQLPQRLINLADREGDRLGT